MLGLITIFLLYLLYGKTQNIPQDAIRSGLQALFDPSNGNKDDSTNSNPIPELPSHQPSISWIALALFSACNWGLFGLAGGIARDLGAGRRGILGALLCAGLVTGVLFCWVAADPTSLTSSQTTNG